MALIKQLYYLAKSRNKTPYLYYNKLFNIIINILLLRGNMASVSGLPSKDPLLQQSSAEQQQPKETPIVSLAKSTQAAVQSVFDLSVPKDQSDIVMMQRRPSSTGEGDSSVYFTAKETMMESVFHTVGNELRSETKTMYDLEATDLETKEPLFDTEFLVTDKEIVVVSLPGGAKEMIHKKEGSPEPVSTLQEALSGKLSRKERIQYCSQLLSGLASLHKAGYAHGNLQQKSCGIYEKEASKSESNPPVYTDQEKCLKLGDFRKSAQVGPEGSAPFTGDTPFVPPEMAISQKGDVYSAGLMLVQIYSTLFEPKEEAGKDVQNLASKHVLPWVPPENRKMEAGKNQKGLEKFLVQREEFFATSPEGMKGFKGFIHRCKMVIKYPFLVKDQQRILTHYIDRLCQNLVKNQVLDDVTANFEGKTPKERFQSLLLNMTNPIKEKRPTMEYVSKEFNSIFRDSERVVTLDETFDKELFFEELSKRYPTFRKPKKA